MPLRSLNLELEYEVWTAAGTAANYPAGHAPAIASGDKWNAANVSARQSQANRQNPRVLAADYRPGLGQGYLSPNGSIGVARGVDTNGVVGRGAPLILNSASRRVDRLPAPRPAIIAAPQPSGLGCNDLVYALSWTGNAPNRVFQGQDRLYKVRVRIAGILELRPYQGGVQQGYFNDGGVIDAAESGFNSVTLKSSIPKKTYRLNQGPESGVKVLDYEVEIPVRGNSRISVDISLVDIGTGVNHDDLVIERPNRYTPPQPYPSQFVQIFILDIK